MRELIQKCWCDQCWHEDHLQQEATATYTIGLVAGEQRPSLKILELCDTHNKLAVDLMDLLKDIGQLADLKPRAVRLPSAAAPVEPPRKACPICRRDVQANVMVNHIWTNHRTDERPPTLTVCPECRKTVATGQGMSAHRRTAHNYDAVLDALSGVKGWKG
jgi:hypothetical protein